MWKLSAALLTLGFGVPSASAALLSGSPSASPPQPENLTTDGTFDWAIWNYTTNPINGTNNIPASNRKNGVTALISNVTTLLGNGRGTTTTTPTQTYTYTDGVSPTSITNATQGEVFDTTLNNSNAGVSFTITAGQAGVPETVKVFLTGFQATPTFTATLPGAPTYTDSSFTYVGSRPPRMYTLNFTPDNTGDLLTITYKIGTSTDAFSNVDLQAVTVAPEPASLGLLAAAAGGLLLRRRRLVAK
jgi:hypothetical protein